MACVAATRQPVAREPVWKLVLVLYWVLHRCLARLSFACCINHTQAIGMDVANSEGGCELHDAAERVSGRLAQEVALGVRLA